MAPELAFWSDFKSRAISPLMEMGAYEALWDKPGTTFKTLSEKFAARPDAVPSDFVTHTKAHEYADFVQMRFREADVTRFGARVHGAGEYPQKLRDAAHPIELLYYQGWWDLVESRSRRGSRHARTHQGRHCTRHAPRQSTGEGQLHHSVGARVRHRHRRARNGD